jgi:hypothetical protein
MNDVTAKRLPGSRQAVGVQIKAILDIQENTYLHLAEMAPWNFRRRTRQPAPAHDPG